ncbi:hypothetical protein PF004_g3657 [Phytophthora fragariae]|uniref:Uncharacterized protein n=1 Tax=Phytophthora fragariae TaxID=53985 RepID=A0A6G0PL61_9STRA|nr:hypothetical protein PF004_g3657 [Phytophthora fragariae]
MARFDVGHPNAFVQPVGEQCDQWAYRLVTGYKMQAGSALLHVRFETQVLRITLADSQSVIAVDRLNYALRTGSGVNVTVLNALELLDRQNDVIAACGKSRSGLPASVLSTMVSVEFAPDENVPLIRPDTLEIVFVRRQHIVDCELDGRNTNPANVFKDPILSESPAPVTRPNVGAANSITNNFGLACSDSEDETKDNDTSTVQANISLVRLQNRSLRKRTREADAVDDDLFLPDDTDLPVFPTKGFYNSTVYNFIKTGAVFMMRFAVLSRPDAATCNRLVFWINSKLGKFRSQIIAANIQTAALVGLEFTRNDDHLLELYQAQQDRQRIAQLSIKSTRTPGSTRPSSTRDPRMTKVSSVPRELLAMLPKQGNKTMCMRFLSKKGCTGPAPGQCSDPNRAHFKPLALPADAKTFIDKTFLGLGPDFQDL